MERKDFYKHFFRFAALWNIFAALPFFLDYKKAFEMLGETPPADMVWCYITFIFVAVFGAGYYIISRDVEKNHGIAFLGAVAKIIIFAIFLYYSIIGELSILFPVVGFGDFVFACFFIEFLLYYRKK